MMNIQSSYGIQSTAGAVPVRNEKGKTSLVILNLSVEMAPVLNFLVLIRVIALSTKKTIKISIEICGKLVCHNNIPNM